MIPLVPQPRHLVESASGYRLRPGDLIACAPELVQAVAPVVSRLMHDIDTACDWQPELVPGSSGAITISKGEVEEAGVDAYRLAIDEAGVQLVAPAIGGLRSGLQALRQLVQSFGAELPGLTIHDYADFPVRGFYHDCTRGRVPKRATLLELVETLALCRYNHLQLYIEHSYAFPGLSDLWAGADPLSADDVLAVQARCQELGIELVPSVSCFGHSYTLLRSHRRGHLNELAIDAMARPYSIRDRMGHYTLDPSNPESLATVRGLLEAYVPLHHSEWVNICCDETVDLGTGRNRERAEREGTGRLYIEFVKQVCAIVHELGRRPMLWGDILLEHPEMIRELPADACILHWDYDTQLQRPIEPVANSGRAWLGCPGIHTWKDLLAQPARACQNLRAMASATLAHGGNGLLITDWGDLGHASVAAAGRYGLALGAQAAWCAAAASDDQIDRAWAALSWGDPEGVVPRALRTIDEVALAWWFRVAVDADPSPEIPEDWRDATSGFAHLLIDHDPAAMRSAVAVIAEARTTIEHVLARGGCRDDRDLRELACAAWGSELFHEAALHAQRASGRPAEPTRSAWSVADDLRRFEQRYARLWHARHRPSEYRRVQAIILRLAERLDAIGALGADAPAEA